MSLVLVGSFLQSRKDEKWCQEPLNKIEKVPMRDDMIDHPSSGQVRGSIKEK